MRIGRSDSGVAPIALISSSLFSKAFLTPVAITPWSSSSGFGGGGGGGGSGGGALGAISEEAEPQKVFVTAAERERLFFVSL